MKPLNSNNLSVTTPTNPSDTDKPESKGSFMGKVVEKINLDSTLMKVDELAPCFSKSEKANPLGSHLITNYYLGKNPDREHQSFNLNSPKDIECILKYTDNSKPYVLNVLTGGLHQTPVIISGNDVFIMESLGVSKSKVGKNSVAQIVAAFKNTGDDFNFYVSSENRQMDSVSCGIDHGKNMITY